MNCSNCSYGNLILLSRNENNILFSCSGCDIIYKLDLSVPENPDFSFKDGALIASGLVSILGLFGIEDISEIFDIFQ